MKETQAPPYTTDGIWFKDSFGRIAILRGCNLSGSAKTPYTPNGETGNPAGLSHTMDEQAHISFVGRPFPEEEADEHLSRLASWGFTFLRWCITWEAVAHTAPDIYDEEFLAYLRRILKKCETYGIHVFIDPHQDVWSRWTGGDGAPLWTLEAIGFDSAHMAETGAAITHQDAGAKMPQMIWASNHARYACATMFTLFFAGNVFAPHCMINGEHIQDYLQNHFIAAMKHTARRLKECKAIVGFGTLNEPHFGFIGHADLTKIGSLSSPKGICASPFDTMCAASGFQTAFKKMILGPFGPIYYGNEQVNTKGIPLFKDGYTCPWKNEGVWKIADGKPVLCKKEYFARNPQKPLEAIDFGTDFLKPFQQKYINALREKHEHYIMFVEGVPFADRAQWKTAEKTESKNICDAFHWYDGKTLLLKKWLPFFTIESDTRKLVFGKKTAKRSFTAQLQKYTEQIRSEHIVPLLGEFGVPFDLNKGASYKTNTYTAQEEALSCYYDAIDSNLLSSTIWNYTPDNTHAKGDGWNGEDLSIFCKEDAELEKNADLHAHIRAKRGFCRPYPLFVAGIPLRIQFNRNTRVFTLEWEAKTCLDDNGKQLPTEIYIPSLWYPENWTVSTFDGSAVIEEKPEIQRLFVTVSTEDIVRIYVSPIK